MPSLYAHNKFGKKVIKNLPFELRKIIKDYPDSFRIGLQGPDILFFHKPFYNNKIIQTGLKIHKTDAYDFFDNAISVVCATGFDSSCHAYILGFICHFVLDSSCHPYINQSMKDTNCGHIEIEGEFDRYLLEYDGKISHEYKSYHLVPTDMFTALSIAPFYQGISAKTILTSLRHMKIVKKLFVAPGFFKRTVLDSIMRATLHYKKIKGHIIFPYANKKCLHCSEELYQKLYDSVPLATKLIEEFETSLLTSTPLPDTFHGTFNG